MGYSVNTELANGYSSEGLFDIISRFKSSSIPKITY